MHRELLCCYTQALVRGDMSCSESSQKTSKRNKLKKYNTKEYPIMHLPFFFSFPHNKSNNNNNKEQYISIY